MAGLLSQFHYSNLIEEMEVPILITQEGGVGGGLRKGINLSLLPFLFSA